MTVSMVQISRIAGKENGMVDCGCLSNWHQSALFYDSADDIREPNRENQKPALPVLFAFCRSNDFDGRAGAGSFYF
jgi:hypothetical protein